ncbi:DUF2254 family protein [Rhizomonospora bruguierae]|uniref:DUF2254 family protein n=1 Tax=Rhizomonospora bruguierae TaxID=1581705 RepID=UPI001BCDA136|nr:DUF2254 family protein [Micromonospora sp. NBRC 107566]
MRALPTAFARALSRPDRIDAIARDLHRRVDGRYPPPSGVDRTLTAPRAGTVLRLDADGLVDAATRADCMLELVPAIGEPVGRGAPLLRVHGCPERLPGRHLPLLVEIGPAAADPAPAFARLAGIAEDAVRDRDLGSAERAVDRLHEALRRLAARPMPAGRHYDAEGGLRLILRGPTWDGYLRLALDPVIAAGAATPRVAHRLRAALTDLMAAAPSDRRPPLRRRLDALGGRPAYRIPTEIAAALVTGA